MIRYSFVQLKGKDGMAPNVGRELDLSNYRATPTLASYSVCYYLTRSCSWSTIKPFCDLCEKGLPSLS